MPSHFLVVPVAILLLFVAYLLHPLVWLIASLCLSPLARLPSPPSPSLLLGNLAAIADQENNDVVTSWTRTYGSTFTYRGFIGGRRLLTTDPAALNHILGHAYDFPKPEFVRASLAAMVAGDDGLLTVEGATHRRQRKILNQAFTTPHIRSLYPIFTAKAIELRDLILGVVDAPSDAPPPSPSLVAKSSQSPVMDSFAILRSLDPIRPKSTTDIAGFDVSASSGVVIDVLSYFARATLDVIGLAGFGYTFNALASPHSDGPDGVPAPDNELSAAFAAIFATARKFRVLNVFQSWFPPLRRYQPNGASIKEAQATIRRVGSALIDDRLGEKGLLCPDDHPRDLLSVLVCANDAAGAGALSHEEVISQISTFLAAGHETSASALTWTLYALARAPHEQNTLREALLKLPNDVSSDDLLALPELDHVIRESLRLHAPVSSTMRVYAGEAVETVIPLSRGVRVRAPSLMETWRVPVALTTSLLLGITLGRTWALAAIICVTLFEIISKRRRKDSSEFALGEWIEQDHIRLRRGDIITIPIQAVNRDPEVWGEDAREFRPSRWKEPPPAATSVNGLYPRTLTFLNGSPIHGNRACIGYRFAIAEIAIFLSTLLRVLEFSIDDDVRIEKRVNVVTRPFVASTPELGNQMPLRVRRVVHP